MKKNNTAKKAALDALQISEALKESTQKSLQSMLNEAISNTLMEATDEKCCEEEDVDDDTEDSYDVEDVNTEETPADDNCEGGECEPKEDGEAEGADDDDWSDMEDYKVGDNDYDFTGVDGDEVLKVYNKLGDDDKIFVKKDEDGNYELKDEETGAEYVIELGDDADSADEFEGDEDADIEFELGDEEGDDEGEDFDIDLDDEENDDEDGDIDIELDDEEGDDEGEDFDIELDDEEGEDFDIDLDDDEMLNEEELGYDTSHKYQKDVMSGLNMNEPADSSSTNDWDAGVPKGNSRPFSGYKNKESNLFTKAVNEAGREIRKSSKSTSATIAPQDHDEYMAGGSHNVHTKGQSGKTINEDIKRIINAAKKIQAENKQYKEAITNIKKSLYEAAVLNVTLGQVVKLLSENTTTKAEKASIVERFNKVKTIAESKSLYDTVSRELNEAKGGAFSIDKGYSTTSKEALNETTLYQNNPCINMMERMNNLEKMWKNK